LEGYEVKPLAWKLTIKANNVSISSSGSNANTRIVLQIRPQADFALQLSRKKTGEAMYV
jgi:hypothetical protein